MRLRRLVLVPLLAALGAAVAVLPALAASEAKIEVAESCHGYVGWACWSPATASIGAGESVTFADKTSQAARIVWLAAGPAPTCSASVPVSPAPASAGWEGTCTFERAGSYEFEGPGLYYPRGTVTVGATGTSTGTTTSTGPTPVGAPSTSPTPGAGTQTTGSGSSGSPLAGDAAQALKLPRSEHGRKVRGTVDVSEDGAGATLEVLLLARRAGLAVSSGSLRVGRARMPVNTGAVSFAVPVDARARRALRARGRLALTVEVTLVPAHGSAVKITRTVLLRP